MDNKILNALSKKMKDNEFVVDLINVSLYTHNERRYENTLAITSVCFYFMDHTHLRRTLGIQQIKVITLSTFSQEIILHCLQEDIRMNSPHNVKIINNILKIRQKIFKNNTPLTVLLEKQKTLAQFASDSQKDKPFWQKIFGKKPTQQKDKQKYRWTGRSSYCQLEVNDRNFALQIGRKIYQSMYQNVQLLYVSGSLGFIFNEFDYIKKQIDQKTYHFKHKDSQQYILMRRIIKTDPESARKMRRYIETFKLQDSKQQIYYALQTNKHFQIIMPTIKGQRSLEKLLCEDTQISDIDLVTIFFKLMNAIDGQLQIMHSLSPHQIIVSHGITISSIFCLDPNQRNIDYIAPQQLDPQLSVVSDPELTNFWKIGMLLYQAAFACLPFPVEYLAGTVKYKLKFDISFPQSKRTVAFKNFLLQILQISPSKRAGGTGWKKNVLAAYLDFLTQMATRKYEVKHRSLITFMEAPSYCDFVQQYYYYLPKPIFVAISNFKNIIYNLLICCHRLRLLYIHLWFN